MDMVGVPAPTTQPDRPAAREAHRSIAPAAEERMLWIDWRQVANVVFYCRNNGRTDLSDQRIDATEQWPVGLRAAAYRLVEIFAPGTMQGPEMLGKPLERRQCRA